MSPQPDPTRGRWWIVVAAVLVQLALGAVYAWSVFNAPLQQQFGWSKSEAVLPFEFVIGTIFVGSLIGGRIQDRRGPRPVALGGVVLYSAGVMLASLVSSGENLWLLVATYEGTPAYLGVFSLADGRAQVWVAARDDCRLLASATSAG